MMLNQPATPAAEAEALPTPALPDINQPASPGPGPEGLPTPALPDINQPASPGPGPEGLPTPSLPSQPQITCPGTFCCPAGYTAATVGRGQTFTDLLLLHNVSYQALSAANPTLSVTSPQAGTRYCVPPAGSRRLCPTGSYSRVIGAGENIYTLAQSLGVTPGALLLINTMLAPGDFVPGRVVCVT